jgi:hypothetical protein
MTARLILQSKAAGTIEMECRRLLAAMVSLRTIRRSELYTAMTAVNNLADQRTLESTGAGLIDEAGAAEGCGYIIVTALNPIKLQRGQRTL